MDANRSPTRTFIPRRDLASARSKIRSRASNRRGIDDRLVRQTMRLAQRYSKRPADPFLYMMTAGLIGFAFALMIGPRPRPD
jgi:hypothetical protein